MNIPTKVNSITYNQSLKSFDAIISVADNIYNVVLSDFKESESAQASNLACDICNWIYSNHEMIREFCASKLLDLKNKVWLEDQEEPLSKKGFVEAIELESIGAYSNGSFTLYFDDKDIFWGHIITVNVSKDYILVDAGIAG